MGKAGIFQRIAAVLSFGVAIGVGLYVLHVFNELGDRAPVTGTSLWANPAARLTVLFVAGAMSGLVGWALFRSVTRDPQAGMPLRFGRAGASPVERTAGPSPGLLLVPFLAAAVIVGDRVVNADAPGWKASPEAVARIDPIAPAPSVARKPEAPKPVVAAPSPQAVLTTVPADLAKPPEPPQPPAQGFPASTYNAAKEAMDAANKARAAAEQQIARVKSDAAARKKEAEEVASAQPADEPPTTRAPLPPPAQSLPTSIEGHAGAVDWVAVSPDGKSMVSAGIDHKIKLWDLAADRLIRDVGVHKDMARSAVFLADGKRVLTAGDDGEVVLRNLADGKVLHVFSATDHGRVNGLALTPDGRRW